MFGLSERECDYSGSDLTHQIEGYMVRAVLCQFLRGEEEESWGSESLRGYSEGESICYVNKYINIHLKYMKM